MFQAVAAWCQLNAAPVGEAEPTHQHKPAPASDAAALATCKDRPQQQENDSYAVYLQLQDAVQKIVATQQEQQHIQQQEQQQAPGCDLASTQNVEVPAAASTAAPGSADDVLDLLQLVRFGFMSDADRQVSSGIHLQTQQSFALCSVFPEG